MHNKATQRPQTAKNAVCGGLATLRFARRWLRRYVSMKFISNIFWAIITISCGYIFFTTGWYSTYDVPVPKIAGILLILAGSFVLVNAIRNRKLKSINDYLICRDCLKVYLRTEIESNKCIKCNIVLEALDGFYDRNSDLKANRKT